MRSLPCSIGRIGMVVKELGKQIHKPCSWPEAVNGDGQPRGDGISGLDALVATFQFVSPPMQAVAVASELELAIEYG